jgi:hypothetical protein
MTTPADIAIQGMLQDRNRRADQSASATRTTSRSRNKRR